MRNTLFALLASVSPGLADASAEWTFTTDAKPVGVCEGRVTKNSVRTGPGSDFPCRDW